MDIDLKKIISITCHNSLYLLLKTLPNAILVESLDAKRIKSVKNFTRNKITSLRDISVYAKTNEKNIALSDVISGFYTKFNSKIDESLFDNPDKMRHLMAQIAPNYDFDRVGLRDIRKIIGWYNTLLVYQPQIFIVSGD